MKILFLSVGMGRKLRFFVTKNYERKKALAAQELALPVSIPLCLGVAVHQSSVEVDVEKPSELTVILPISSYANAPCQDLAHLRSRLKASNQLPSGWIDGSNSGTPLVFCYIRCEPPTFSAKMLCTGVSSKHSSIESCEHSLLCGEGELSRGNEGEGRS
jgi:hypothetical protein